MIYPIYMFAACDHVICSSLTLVDVVRYNSKQGKIVCDYSAVLSCGYSASCRVAVFLSEVKLKPP